MVAEGGFRSSENGMDLEYVLMLELREFADRVNLKCKKKKELKKIIKV